MCKSRSIDAFAPTINRTTSYCFIFTEIGERVFPCGICTKILPLRVNIRGQHPDLNNENCICERALDSVSTSICAMDTFRSLLYIAYSEV